MNRINIITLGVQDLKKSLLFYRDGLGFEAGPEEENLGIVFLNCQGTKLALYPLDELAKDISNDNPPVRNGFPGITLAYNCKSKAEMDDIFKKVEGLGGTIAKSPTIAVWGGYSGYFTDLDGYYWEVAYGEGWEFDANNMLIL